MPIQSQGIITRDNVSVDVSAVAYFRVVDAVKSVVAIENVDAAIDQIAQTTLRKVVGQHTLDETLSETDRINLDIREILDVTTLDWGVEVTLVELKDIQLPDSMKRAMARQAEAEREKRAKIINAEGESLAAAALGRRLGHHDGPPAGAPAAQPAEPGRDRRRQEHHRRLPGPADDHHRRTRVPSSPANPRPAPPPHRQQPHTSPDRGTAPALPTPSPTISGSRYGTKPRVGTGAPARTRWEHEPAPRACATLSRA